MQGGVAGVRVWGGWEANLLVRGQFFLVSGEGLDSRVNMGEGDSRLKN